MKRFIRYLYEYVDGRKSRNVGFVRVDQEESATTVQVHGKGLHAGTKGNGLSVYLFFPREKECMGIYAGQTEEADVTLNYELCFTKEETGTEENYDRIAGIILRDENGHWYAALWDEDTTDVCKMKVWEKEEGTAHCEKKEEEEQNALPQKTSEDILDKDVKNNEEKVQKNVFNLREENDYGKEEQKERNIQSEDQERNIQSEMKRENDAENEKRTIQKGDKEEKDKTEKNNDVEKEKHFHVRKIQRKDLVMLPRCEWRLANNSFLVHGYYNYHHLILTVADDRLKLGVPGVYYPQEAKAAESFGFPEFLSLAELGIELTEEEKNDQENFGYWCRNVRGSVDIMKI